MLGLFGLFGALLAGLVADSMFGGPTGKADDHEEDTPPDTTASPDQTEGGNLLDWVTNDIDPAADMSGVTRNGPDAVDFVPTSTDAVYLADVDVSLLGGASSDMLNGFGGNDTLIGGDGNDHLAGQAGNDFIQGGAGTDVAHGGVGADTLQGGAGDDLLAGEDGDDKLVGGAGADTLLGHEGADRLYGGAGADTLMAGGGDDSVIGGEGDDWVAGGLGDDHLTGDAGQDTVDGGAGNDALDGRELLNAFPEMDFLNGGDGNDTLTLGAGDYATGGEGADWFELTDLAAGDPIANIADYNGDEDRLVVVFDPALHPDPQLSLELNANTDDMVVLLDGVPLAMVQGGAGMTLDDVLLTPALAE